MLMSSPKVFQRENIYCFELEVTAAKDVGRFKLLCNTEDFEKKKLLFFHSVLEGPSGLESKHIFLKFFMKRDESFE